MIICTLFLWTEDTGWLLLNVSYSSHTGTPIWPLHTSCTAPSLTQHVLTCPAINVLRHLQKTCTDVCIDTTWRFTPYCQMFLSLPSASSFLEIFFSILRFCNIPTPSSLIKRSVQIKLLKHKSSHSSMFFFLNKKIQTRCNPTKNCKPLACLG